MVVVVDGPGVDGGVINITGPPDQIPHNRSDNKRREERYNDRNDNDGHWMSQTVKPVAVRTRSTS